MRALLLLLAACSGGPLPQAFVVSDLRVLAMVADPPQVREGETARVTAYFFDPDSEMRNVRVQFYQCAEDAECMFKGTDKVIFVDGDATRIGTDLYAASFDYTAASNALADKSAVAQEYGFDQELLVRGDNGLRFIDGVKRLPILPKVAPVLNSNPRLHGFSLQLNGTALGSDASNDAMVRNTAYVLTPLFDAASVETYTLREFAGASRTLKEEMSFTWSCSPDCTISQRVSFAGDLVTVTTPELGADSGRFTVHVVMRDGRGGEAVHVRTFALLPQTRVY